MFNALENRMEEAHPILMRAEENRTLVKAGGQSLGGKEAILRGSDAYDNMVQPFGSK